MLLRKLLTTLFLFYPLQLMSYPLDGYDETEIERLDGYFHSLLTESGRDNLTAGALQSITELSLSKPARINFPLQQDGRLQNDLMRVVPSGASLSLIDLSNLDRPVYAGIRDDQTFVPGSVGKVMVAVCLLDALARAYPNSIKDRERILREHIITTDGIIETDSHVVPFWDSQNRKIYFRPLVVGDKGNLWTYLDFMLSASSNAAASLIMRETLLINHFGRNYPPSRSEAERFLSSANQNISKTFIQPLLRFGLGAATPFQSSFFTKSGKAKFSGAGSSATTRGLASLLLLMEQGRLVDEFSSLELKRLLYMTQRRERYAGNPLLDDTAIYFKAGSMYRCGGACEKYEGTVENRMNAVALIEEPVAAPRIRYIVSLATNVLRYNSDRLHNETAGKVHQLILARNKR